MNIEKLKRIMFEKKIWLPALRTHEWKQSRQELKNKQITNTNPNE